MNHEFSQGLPSFNELPVAPGGPEMTAWSLWGDGDEVGTINLLTPERVAAGARLAKSGRLFPLNWQMELPDPPLFGREKLTHTLKRKRPYVHDDVYNDFNTQSSTHWDGLTHYGSTQCQCFYNGVTPEEITALPGTRNGIQAWARRGIAGRAVLLDYGRWAEAQGLHPAAGERTPVLASDLMHVAEAQGTHFEVGDIFIVRYGWTAWYEQLDHEQRRAISTGPHTFIGIEQGADTFRFLWNNHFAAVASDAPSFEAWPADPQAGALHSTLLPLWGMPIGEMFYLEALADDCARDGVYEFFLTSSPLNKYGGVASPANAIAIK